MSLTKKEDKYKSYIEEHIMYIRQVWKDIQPLLTGEYWLDDYTWVAIDSQIKIHDASKMDLNEFNGYRQWFYPELLTDKNKEIFDYSWNLHQKSNPHHWEYWIMVSARETKALIMPFKYVFEMLCDWTAMSYKFRDIPSEFYLKNKENMVLHEKTKQTIENWLPIFDKVAEIKRRN